MKRYISEVFILFVFIFVMALPGSAWGAGKTYVPVLMYHNIIDGAIKPSEVGVTVNYERFMEQMEYLKLAGYNTISVDDYIGFMEGNKPLPPNPIMITFDDGYESNYKYAYPILKKLGMRAVINVIVSETKGEPNYHYWDPTHLTWEEMKEISDSGVIDIESHTYDLHYYASNGKKKIPAASGQIEINGKLESFDEYTTRVKNDFKKSKDMIEKNVGKRVKVLSYPYGVGNSTTKKLAREVGYEAMFTIKEGVMRQGDDIMSGKRIKVKGTETGFDIVRNIYRAAGVKGNVPFYDLEKHWAGNDIMEMMLKGYMKGYPDKTFRPDSPVTRAEMATMVSSVFGLKPDGKALPFNDVMKNAWYYVPVSSCYADGIIGFYGNSFGPDIKATREEVVSVLSPFIKNGQSADLSIYKDTDEISPFAVHAMEKAVAAGIIKGKGEGRLSPKDDVTRAELAVMIERVLNQQSYDNRQSLWE